MADYESSSILIGTFVGIIFSIVAALFGFSGPGILTLISSQDLPLPIQMGKKRITF